MTNGLKPHFIMFARYNQWANDRLHAAAAQLSDEDYRRDRGAFFKSVHGTLNHLLVTDMIWLRRLTGTGNSPDRLDAILFERLPDLRAARETQDRRLLAWVESLEPAGFEKSFRYIPITNPAAIEQKVAAALSHLFNHQTHHRGQAHALLTAAVGRAPELDLLYFQRRSESPPA